MIAIVAALAENGVIGRANELPWRLPADLKHFRRITMGKPIVMGRKTFESIGRPLDGRTNIVISGNPAFTAPGCVIRRDLREVYREYADQELLVIGGATIYRQALMDADRLYLTLIHAEFEGDAYFPRYEPADWVERERTDHPADDNNVYAYSFVTLDRRPLRVA